MFLRGLVTDNRSSSTTSPEIGTVVCSWLFYVVAFVRFSVVSLAFQFFLFFASRWLVVVEIAVLCFSFYVRAHFSFFICVWRARKLEKKKEFCRDEDQLSSIYIGCMLVFGLLIRSKLQAVIYSSDFVFHRNTQLNPTLLKMTVLMPSEMLDNLIIDVRCLICLTLPSDACLCRICTKVFCFGCLATAMVVYDVESCPHCRYCLLQRWFLHDTTGCSYYITVVFCSILFPIE